MGIEMDVSTRRSECYAGDVVEGDVKLTVLAVSKFLRWGSSSLRRENGGRRRKIMKSEWTLPHSRRDSVGFSGIARLDYFLNELSYPSYLSFVSTKYCCSRVR